MVPELVVLALEYYRGPLRYRHLADPRRPLPRQFSRLISELGNALSPQHREQTARALGVSPTELAEATSFFLRDVLLSPDADHYRVLGLTYQSPPETIRQHYQLLVGLFHPDRSPGIGEREAAYTARLNDAYNTLRNPEKRARYDQTIKMGGTATQLDVDDRDFFRPLAPIEPFPGAAATRPVRPSRRRLVALSALGLLVIGTALVVLLHPTPGPALRSTVDLRQQSPPRPSFLAQPEPKAAPWAPTATGTTPAPEGVAHPDQLSAETASEPPRSSFGPGPLGLAETSARDSLGRPGTRVAPEEEDTAVLSGLDHPRLLPAVEGEAERLRHAFPATREAIRTAALEGNAHLLPQVPPLVDVSDIDGPKLTQVRPQPVGRTTAERPLQGPVPAPTTSQPVRPTSVSDAAPGTAPSQAPNPSPNDQTPGAPDPRRAQSPSLDRPEASGAFGDARAKPESDAQSVAQPPPEPGARVDSQAAGTARDKQQRERPARAEPATSTWPAARDLVPTQRGKDKSAAAEPKPATAVSPKPARPKPNPAPKGQATPAPAPRKEARAAASPPATTSPESRPAKTPPPLSPADVVHRLTQTYQRGDLDGFLHLFDPKAQINGGKGIGHIRTRYADMFARLPERRLSVQGLSWRKGRNDRLIGKGVLRVSARQSAEADWGHATGTITFELVSAVGGYRIASMIHRLD